MSSTHHLAEDLLRKIGTTSQSEMKAFIQRCSGFLDYIFDNYGGFFVTQRTYCLAEHFEHAPDNILQFFKEVS